MRPWASWPVPECRPNSRHRPNSPSLPQVLRLPAMQVHHVLAVAFLGLVGTAADGSEPVFPKPDPARAFPELKVFDGAGRPFRHPLEDWAGARERVARDPAWQAWLTDREREVNDWMVRRRDHVEWKAGWWHDFVSPKDGSFLIWTADEPGETTLHSRSDPAVQLTPKLQGAWVFGFRSRHAAKIEEAAQLFRLTGETRYGDWAAAQIDFYATNFARWNGRTDWGNERSRLAWQSLDEAVNLVRYVHAVRTLDDHVAPDRKQRWLDTFFRPETEILNRSFQIIHNIACWHRSAEAQVALCFGDEPLWQRAVEGPFGIRRQLAAGVTSDYLWLEQSLGYNSYVVRALQPFFEEALLAGRGDDLGNELCILQNLVLAPIAIRFPTGQLPNPADSTGGLSFAPNAGFLASVRRLFPTAIGLRRASRERSWDTLLDPPEPPPAEVPLPPVRSRHLESSRMAVLREGPWQVFFHYGQNDRSHAEAEALNFEAFFGDTDVTHDPGTVGYGSPLHRGFFTRGPAHNVPLINGEGQVGWNPGRAIAFDADNAIVRAAQDNYRKGVGAERTLRIEGNRLIDIVKIQSESGDRSRLGLVLHLQGAAELPVGFAPDPDFAANPPGPPFVFWEDPQSAMFRDTATVPVRFGDLRLNVCFEVPGEFRLTHARTPDVPPAKRDSFYLETRGIEATFTTTLSGGVSP
ncbi:MAG: heparinase II/III family protein [Verrucomicrobiales bacterium]|nr:heparinase II/III family protein [Verrucomicrobiales bacterium]